MSTVVAANQLGESSSVSLLLAGSGSSLQEAASQAASCHPSVSEVTNVTFSSCVGVFFCLVGLKGLYSYFL